MSKLDHDVFLRIWQTEWMKMPNWSAKLKDASPGIFYRCVDHLTNEQFIAASNAAMKQHNGFPPMPSEILELVPNRESPAGDCDEIPIEEMSIAAARSRLVAVNQAIEGYTHCEENDFTRRAKRICERTKERVITRIQELEDGYA